MIAGTLSLVTFVLLGAEPAAGNYFPPADPKAGGIRDLMLDINNATAWETYVKGVKSQTNGNFDDIIKMLNSKTVK